MPIADATKNLAVTLTGLTLFGEGSKETDGMNAGAAFFTGKPKVDELGYSFLFRNYRPEQSKWQTADPLGYPDGMNNFAYCSNGVAQNFDYLGLADWYLKADGNINTSDSTTFGDSRLAVNLNATASTLQATKSLQISVTATVSLAKRVTETRWVGHSCGDHACSPDGLGHVCEFIGEEVEYTYWETDSNYTETYQLNAEYTVNSQGFISMGGDAINGNKTGVSSSGGYFDNTGLGVAMNSSTQDGGVNVGFNAQGGYESHVSGTLGVSYIAGAGINITNSTQVTQQISGVINIEKLLLEEVLGE